MNVIYCEGQHCAHVIVNDKEQTRQVFEYLNQKDTDVIEYLGKTFQTKLLHDISSEDSVQPNLSSSDNVDTVVEENFVKQILQSMEPVHSKQFSLFFLPSNYLLRLGNYFYLKL